MKKRFAIFIMSFIALYIFNFFIPRLMPGDPFSHNASVSGEDMEGLTAKDIEELKEYYGLDEPLAKQFIATIKDNITGKFGQSILYKKPVSQVIKDRLPWTIYMMVTTLLLSTIFGVWLALLSLSSLKIGKIIYNVMSVLNDIPSFIIGILLLFLVAAKVKWIPLSGNLTPFKSYKTIFEYLGDVMVHSMLPIAALILTSMPSFYFTARASFKTVIGKEYVKYAQIKGVKNGVIRYRYIMLNGIMPVIAKIFLSFGAILGSTLLVESVFAYPGLGKVLKDAVLYRDFILIQGVFLLSMILTLICSLISDLINDYLERMRVG